MTVEDAVANAARIAAFAENETTNPAMMEQLTALANFWLDAAWLLLERE